MKKLGGTICDGCRKVIPVGLRPISIKSKKGRTLHFCEKVECQQNYNKPKVKKVKTSSLIADHEAAEFITESNAIEAIDIPFPSVFMGVAKGKHKIPEISGQVNAMQYMVENHKLDLTPKMIVTLHTKLMKGLLSPWYLGIRKDWVRVGSRLCPAPIAVRPMLEKWCEKVNTLKNPTEEEIWQTHLAYESIHPFIDGNGRSGRLLWLWLRYKHGYSYKCVFNATKFDFYYPQFDPFVWETWISS